MDEEREKTLFSLELATESPEMNFDGSSNFCVVPLDGLNVKSVNAFEKA